MIPMIAWAVTLLPEPDSPTIARVSPASTENDTPLTARAMPSRVRNSTRRSSTSSNGAVGSIGGRLPGRRPDCSAFSSSVALVGTAAPLVEFGVESVAQSVAQEEERENGNEEEGTRNH